MAARMAGKGVEGTIRELWLAEEGVASWAFCAKSDMYGIGAHLDDDLSRLFNGLRPYTAHLGGCAGVENKSCKVVSLREFCVRCY